MSTVCQKTFTIETSIIRLLAYWKLDETTGDRLDSKNGGNLSQVGTVGSGVGKISSAFKQTVAGVNRIEKLGSTRLAFDVSKGCTVCGWFNLVATGTFSGIFGWVLKDENNLPLFDLSLQRITTADPPPARLYASICDNILLNCYNIKLDATIYYGVWTFFRFWIDPADNKLRLEINGGITNEVAIGFTLPQVLIADFEIGRGGPDYLVDELGVWEGVLSNGDADELYNANAGTTYPNVPHP